MFILTKKTTPFGTISKPNIKIAERGTFDTPNTQIHDCSLYWLDISNTQIHARSLYWLDTPNTQIHACSLYCIDTPNTQIHARSLYWLDTPNTQMHARWLYWLDTSNTQMHARSLYWLDTSNTQIHARSLYWIYTGTSIKGIINGSLINLIWSNLMYASHQYVVPKTMVKNNCIDSSLIARKTILYFEMSR